MNSGYIEWSKVPLGEKQDREIAEELGIPVSTVAAARQRRGIKPQRARRVEKARTLNWDNIPFGKKPDEVLAEELGISTYRVTEQRLSRNIPAFRRRVVRPRRHNIDWDLQPIGKKPDTVLAKELGVSNQTVRAERVRRNIPAFSGSGYTYEGNPCNSSLEAMYDAYLHSTGVVHKHEVPVSGTPYTADVQLEDGTLVEIIGMIEYRKYESRLKVKLDAYAAARLNLITITRDEVFGLYQESTLPALFSQKWRVCPKCGANTKWFSKGLCQRCYKKHEYKRPTIEAVCANCGRLFNHTSKRQNKYCSRECYHRSTRKYNWPSDETLLAMVSKRNIHDVAVEIGTRPALLRDRIRNIGLRAVEAA